MLIVNTTFEELDENYYFHYLNGVDEGISLDVEPVRKWAMFFLQGSSLVAHDSIVFQPWTLDEKKEKSFYPLQLFTTVEKRFNQHSKPYMFVSRLDVKYHSHLEKIAEIAISVQQLYDYLTEIFLGLQKMDKPRTVLSLFLLLPRFCHLIVDMIYGCMQKILVT